VSAPDPEKWKATECMVGPLMSGLCLSAKYSGAAVLGHVEIVANAVARRRALAELKALQVDEYGDVDYIPTWKITNRIAAIEAEEA
jgi:hypothetical protein